MLVNDRNLKILLSYFLMFTSDGFVVEATSTYLFIYILHIYKYTYKNNANSL